MEKIKLLRLPEVLETTALPKSTLYARIKAGTFPKPVKLSARSVAWRRRMSKPGLQHSRQRKRTAPRPGRQTYDLKGNFNENCSRKYPAAIAGATALGLLEGKGKPCRRQAAQSAPYDPRTGRHAAINDPETFVTFGEALAGVNSGQFEGLNYAFGYDEFLGIDLDRCINPDTGDIPGKAGEIVRRFQDAGAYLERSPSGLGLRIICKGTMPHFGKGHGEFHTFEAYGRGSKGLHFLSITGNAIQVVDTVPDCTEALSWFFAEFLQRPEVARRSAEVVQSSPELSDEEVIQLARNSRKGGEFLQLFDNGTTGDHSSDDLRLCSMLGFYTQDEEQIDRIFRESALFRLKWAERADYRDSTIHKALESLTATYQRREAETRHGTSEAEAARRFVEGVGGDNFRVQRQARRPIVWAYDAGAGIWKIDHHKAALLNAVREVGRQILSEITDERDAQRRDKLYKLAKKLETRRALDDITTLAIYQLREFDPNATDSDDELLCVANGQLNLRTGRLMTHDRNSFWTRKSSVAFDPEAECPTFQKFLTEFCCGDKELERFVQQWLGYCCSGRTTEQRMAVFFGHGQNGKSILIEITKFALGDFATTTPADTLLQRRSDQTNDVAMLQGGRFVSAIESDEGQALAEGRVKSLTGGDEVVCRKLFEEFVTYRPKFKLNLATNSKPRVSGTDNGIWRRLLLIPCRAEVANPDRRLFEKLKAEAPGILNWMVAGYQDWRTNGLVIPECVAQATAEYRQESDTIGRFLNDYPPPFDPVKSSVMYKQYSLWAADQGHKAFSQIRFTQKLSEKGFEVLRRSDGNYLRRPR
ncbi:phage/plasmid primase, P4 family [Methylomonas koyamae]|uniref:phage/plasmid primase, P4 family n=1 Tax=Methylomonas koyamae TaxID=702114 RepID=UPI000AC7AF78|nr:phage/plasmid primase, P4 family [Methylomonas koyamae]